MKTALYIIWQLSWGFLQSLAGAALQLRWHGARHEWYHGAYVSYWDKGGSVSLGMFLYVAAEPGYCRRHPGEEGERYRRALLVHEYGHTIQSLLLGPLYLFAVGIPSFTWANSPRYIRFRREQRVSYFSRYPENWANDLGSWATGEPSPGMMME